MSKPKKRDCFWTYAEASRTVPYVRRLLATLREGYIACWFHYRRSLVAADAEGIHAEWLKHRDEGAAILNELDLLGIIPYQSPLRGIGLFRFNVEVEVDADASDDLIGFFVYKDTRDQIETFAFCQDIYDHDGLFGAERPIPDALKAGTTFLKREEVTPVLQPDQETGQ
jgi:hypothetical protein